MRTKTQHITGAVLFAIGAMLLALIPTTSAVAYEGDVETSTSVSVESPVAQGASMGVSVTVDSDVAAAVPPSGSVDLYVNGEFLRTVQLQDGQANFTVDTSGFPVGEHTLTAIYEGDEMYDGSEGSAEFQVVAGSQGGTGTGGDDQAPTTGTTGGTTGGGDQVVTGATGEDVLPGVGGVDAWLIGAAALLIFGGGALLLVRRRTGLA